jgi:hypothetical protein
MDICITVTQYIDTHNRVKLEALKHKYYAIILYSVFIKLQYKFKNNKADNNLTK